jgi:rubrerythrin
MQQKKTNSRSMTNDKKDGRAASAGSTDQHSNNQYPNAGPSDENGDNEEDLQDFMEDEEPENFESQKEDMKMYLNKMNKRIDTLVEALKKADQMMTKMGD